MRLTHWQYLAATLQLRKVDCTAQDQTYGGKCLRCGHDSNKDYSITFVVEPIGPGRAWLKDAENY
jgi:hypothetical protein